jgi:succinate dehydrogenase/fumarate reductase flavoprotein subunit
MTDFQTVSEKLPYSLHQIQEIRQRLESIEVLDIKVKFNNNATFHEGSVDVMDLGGIGSGAMYNFFTIFFNIKVEGEEQTYRITGYNFGLDEVTNLFLKISFKGKRNFPNAKSPTHQLAERKANSVWKPAYSKLQRAIKKKENIKKVEAKLKKAMRKKMDAEFEKVFIHAMAMGYKLKDITRLWKKFESDVKTASIMDA